MNKNYNIGDSIISKINYKNLLTKNKKYIIIDIIDVCYILIGDNYKKCAFIEKCFYTIQEFREIQIEKILK